MEQGLIVVKTPQDLNDEDEQRREADRLSRDREVFISSLAGHIQRQWETNRRAKQEVEQTMLSNLRHRNGKYDAKTLAEIRNVGGSEIFMMLTAAKCRATISWLSDLVLPDGQPPWGLDPSPMPTLPKELEQALQARLDREIQQAMQSGVQPEPEDIMTRAQEMKTLVTQRVRHLAAQGAKLMERQIEDDFQEGGLYTVFEDFLEDFVTFPAGFIKGPIYRNRVKLSWDNGQPAVETKLVTEYERVSPFDMYPSPEATGIQDGDLIERMSMSRDALYRCIGLDGYDEEAIREVLQEAKIGGLNDWLWAEDNERLSLELKDSTALSGGGSNLIDALHYWGSAPGQLLIDWGVPQEAIDDPEREYQIEAIKVGRHIVKCVINDDPLERRPYQKASMYKIPGSFWGMGIPQVMEDIQRMCNATARALANNMGLAAGPQIMLLSDRIATGEDIEGVYPFKIWQFNSDVAGSGKPLEFFQPGSNAGELVAVYKEFEQRADDVTGVPRYAHGNPQATGAASTASGLSQMLEASAKGIRQSVRHIDSGIFRPLVEKQFYYRMRISPVKGYYGDPHIVPRGSAAVAIRGAQELRRNEFLQITANPIDMQIIGNEGRAELLRMASEGLGASAAKVVPDEMTLRMRLAQQAQQASQQPDPEALKQQVAMGKLELMKQQAMWRKEGADLDRQAKLEIANLNAQTAMMKLATEENLKLSEIEAMLRKIEEERVTKRQLLADETKVKMRMGSGL